MPTSCLLIIGNEILSGRTQDKNVQFIASELAPIGVSLKEVRVIPDDADTIVRVVNESRAAYDYVFTTGGIGPTHDDITTECIARAFGVAVVRDAEAEMLLNRHYGQENLNAARLKMADVPEGAALIENPVSTAPGYRIGNVFVMAGVPRIMQAMFGFVKPQLTPGAPMLSRTLHLPVGEGTFAEDLTKLACAHPDVEIGSYPYMRMGLVGTSLVVRGTDERAVDTATIALAEMLRKYASDVAEGDVVQSA